MVSSYSIDADNGALNWQVEIDPETGERLLANPVLADDLVIIAALNGTHLVYAYNQSTGALVWQFDPRQVTILMFNSIIVFPFTNALLLIYTWVGNNFTLAADPADSGGTGP